MINVDHEKRKRVRDLLADPGLMRKEHVRYLPLLAPLLGAEIGEIRPNRFTVRLQAEERQERLLGLCVQLLRAKCSMHPGGVVLLLDNVQWMDEVSWALVDRLREAASPEEQESAPSPAPSPAPSSTPSSAQPELAEAPLSSPPPSRRSPEGASPQESRPSARQQPRARTALLIVACVRCEGCGVRPEGGSAGQPARRSSHRPHGAKTRQAQLRRQLEEHSPDSIVRLNPLRGADLQDVAMRLLGAETIPPQLSSFLLNKSEGNPLYCLEIMSFLQVRP